MKNFKFKIKMVDYFGYKRSETKIIKEFSK